jgi:hypothetical protein
MSLSDALFESTYLSPGVAQVCVLWLLLLQVCAALCSGRPRSPPHKRCCGLPACLCCRYVLSCELDAPGLPQGSGGHYPTLMRLQGYDSSSSKTLVHWCHGAPGAVFMWCAAHEVSGGRLDFALSVTAMVLHTCIAYTVWFRRTRTQLRCRHKG